jgi:hypothetical protein
VLKATGCGVSSRIAVTDPLPMFVAARISEVFAIEALYKSGLPSHNV